MRTSTKLIVFAVAGICSASSVHAACSGSNGRGWGSGKGNGQFSMTAGDKICKISFPGFVDDVKKTRIPGENVTVTKKPAKGALTIVKGQGVIYKPAQGFKGKDKFCTTNRSAKVKGKTLSGCITVTVR
jgi:hypothetical protein